MQNRDWNALLAEPDVGVPKLVATATTPAKNSNSTKSGKETKKTKMSETRPQLLSNRSALVL